MPTPYTPNILVVDDEPLMTRSIQRLLQPEGYEIQTCNNPLEALALIKQTKFDIVLLDVLMPEMSGFELMDALDREHMNTLFVIVTGESTMESAIKALRKGASDYIQKPFEPDELIFRVKNLAKQIRLKRENSKMKVENGRLESQLRQSQKMEAVGTLAGGIAHDFNNVLAVILGNAELALNSVAPNVLAYQCLEKISEASMKAREMIQRLLSFSRKQETEKMPISVSDVVADSLKLLRVSLPANIEINHYFSAGRHVVMGDATQIHQIMFNLCTNAKHAMQDQGGVLNVSIDSVIIDPQSDESNDGLKPGKYVRLVVADTGQGIDPRIMDRIFEPYFTTKEPGSGTGMGLSVVHGIVKNNGGGIRVFSEWGKSTAFHIFLPTPGGDISIPRIQQKTACPGGREHILVVDDEEMVLEVVKKMAELLGYRISAYRSCFDALDAFQLDPGGFDLVITDMTMPNMTGDKLAEKFKAVKTDIPIILLTGYSEQLDKSNYCVSAIDKILMKPVNLRKLATTIRDVLRNGGKGRERRKGKKGIPSREPIF